jgi:hypothetical protein
MDTKLVGIIVLAIILVVVLIVGGIKCSWKKEPYDTLFYNSGIDKNIYTRGTFMDNLDPRNPNMRFDSNVYGGFIKGISPEEGDLAATNKDASSYPLNASKQTGELEPFQQVRRGQYKAGFNDAAQFIGTQKEGFVLPKNDFISSADTRGNGVEYEHVETDFASAVSSRKMQAAQKKLKDSKYFQNTHNVDPQLLEYVVPSELLPVPDMRSQMDRDPSDPSNFMYDRTLFAPLKSRNHNEPDRIRGDIDIAPIKTGWFDIATIPQVDLAKGYVGYFNDIQETMDIQDIAFSRSRDQVLERQDGVMKADKQMNNIVNAIGSDMAKPKLAYGTPPPMLEGPVSDKNAWYNSNMKMAATPYSL